MQTASFLAFKLKSPVPPRLTRLKKDPRIGATEMRKARWFTFELSDDGDLRDALDWLGHAYESSAKAEKRSNG